MSSEQERKKKEEERRRLAGDASNPLNPLNPVMYPYYTVTDSSSCDSSYSGSFDSGSCSGGGGE